MLTPGNMVVLKQTCVKLQELNLELAGISRNAELPEVDEASGMITRAISLIKGAFEIKR